jgi:hypothetical protein
MGATESVYMSKLIFPLFEPLPIVVRDAVDPRPTESLEDSGLATVSVHTWLIRMGQWHIKWSTQKSIQGARGNEEAVLSAYNLSPLTL